MKADDILIELNDFAQIYNLFDVEPRILNESANLIIHLFPYDIVAKVAVYDYKTEAVKECIIKEIAIANHLKSNSVPVVQPFEIMDPGPYECSNHWFSLWKYEEKIDQGTMAAETVISFVRDLEKAMLKYTGKLPILGVWYRVQKSVLNLKKVDNLIYKGLLDQYDILNQYLLSIEEKNLVPSHGDAHMNNIFPTMKNWLWMDFEDVSLMPQYWDLASILANSVLFNGLKIPIAQRVFNDNDLISNKQKFFLILKARVVMSIIGNVDMALQGLGDLEYADWQLSKYEELFEEIDGHLKQLIG